MVWNVPHAVNRISLGSVSVYSFIRFFAGVARTVLEQKKIRYNIFIEWFLKKSCCNKKFHFFFHNNNNIEVRCESHRRRRWGMNL